MTLQQHANAVAKRAIDKHGRIREALVELAVAMERCAAATAPPHLDAVVTSLDTVCSHLVRHFAGEERMQLHAHLAVLLPDQTEALQGLMREHQALRQMAQDCHRLAGHCGSGQLDALRDQVEQFLRRLHAHEEAEDQLMRRALAGTQEP